MSKLLTNSSVLHRSVAIGCLIGAILAANPGLLGAATKAEKQRAAERFVKEALHREIYGESSDRQYLLEQATEQIPNYAPAMWHRGYVRHKNEWIKAEDFSQRLGDDSRIVAYGRVRDKYPNTAEGQLELADWCNKRGLLDQERAHLTQVIQLDPNNTTARSRLGFHRIDGVWMQASDIQDTIDQLQQDRKALAEWRPKMEEILKGLHHRSELKRNSAKAKLLAIKDPEAILAMELVLAGNGEEIAQLVVQVVDNIPQHEASLSLARLAVYSPWEKVRGDAARRLKSRPKETYVPSMLASMYTPIQTRMELARGQGGRLMYRHSFFREGQSENQLLVLDTAYRRVARPGGNRNESLARALSSVDQQMQEAEFNVAEQNARTTELNSRIGRALDLATGQTQNDSPESWWQWWTQQNEVFIEGQKQTRTVQRSQEVAVVDRSQSIDPTGTGQRAAATQRSYPMDCLAAGTPIWTASGLMPVEKIRVGDLVLSQDPKTGELAYKPVLRTTLRPKSVLVKFTAGKEEIEASGGHPFWISGEGWVKARELKPGMELHGVSSTVPVSKVEQSREVQTHNLIVADFNTYFVGEAKILSHDNTIRETTNAIVPGLMDE